MVVTASAFAVVPGGPELLIVLLVFLLLIGVPLVALAALAWLLARRSNREDDRARADEATRGDAADDDLRRRVADLERRVEAHEAAVREVTAARPSVDPRA